jgi:endoglucanase
MVTNTNDTAGTSPGWYTRMVRFPIDVYPGTSTPPSITFFNDANYVSQILQPAVDHATSKGLYIIIDLHFVDDPYTPAIASQVTQFWTQIAPLYSTYSNVFYEVFNESNQTDSWATYKPTMQGWVNLIRGFAPKNLIFAGSPSWDQSMGDAATNPLTGGNIAYTVHMYYQHWTNSWNTTQASTCAAVNPIVMTEWGFNDVAGQPGLDAGGPLTTIYGNDMLTWLEGMNGGWTAWCASNSWAPVMYDSNWNLLVGPEQEGGFVKDWLYTHRTMNQPQ